MEIKISLRQRKSLRLKEFDYSTSWWYYVTICTHHREKIFANVVSGKLILNELGKIVEDEWLKSKVSRQNVDLDYFVIMPNHIHGIIILGSSKDDVRATRRVALTKEKITLQPNSLGSIVGQFKSIVTKRIRSMTNTNDLKVWQRNYYDHIIRNDYDLYRIRKYIQNNPLKWELDEYYQK